jgi:hypothetical protein
VKLKILIKFYFSALRLLDELLRNPRKARYYLRTGRLPLEEKSEQQEEQQADKPETSTVNLKPVWSDKLDPFVASKPGLEISSNLAALDSPHKLHQLSADPAVQAKLINAISPIITTSRAEV